LKGVSIGAHAVVGAGSVVTGHVPPWAVVAGNPARVVKYLTAPDRETVIYT
jgi:acetyltransferase-like isoleucine patch superfamily enzyme